MFIESVYVPGIVADPGRTREQTGSYGVFILVGHLTENTYSSSIPITRDEIEKALKTKLLLFLGFI